MSEHVWFQASLLAPLHSDYVLVPDSVLETDPIPTSNQSDRQLPVDTELAWELTGQILEKWNQFKSLDMGFHMLLKCFSDQNELLAQYEIPLHENQLGSTRQCTSNTGQPSSLVGPVTLCVYVEGNTEPHRSTPGELDLEEFKQTESMDEFGFQLPKHDTPLASHTEPLKDDPALKTVSTTNSTAQHTSIETIMNSLNASRILEQLTIGDTSKSNTASTHTSNLSILSTDLRQTKAYQAAKSIELWKHEIKKRFTKRMQNQHQTLLNEYAQADLLDEQGPIHKLESNVKNSLSHATSMEQRIIETLKQMQELERRWEEMRQEIEDLNIHSASSTMPAKYVHQLNKARDESRHLAEQYELKFQAELTEYQSQLEVLERRQAEFQQWSQRVSELEKRLHRVKERKVSSTQEDRQREERECKHLEEQKQNIQRDIESIRAQKKQYERARMNVVQDWIAYRRDLDGGLIAPDKENVGPGARMTAPMARSTRKSDQEEIERLERERCELIQMGCYAETDVLIRQINDRIACLRQ